MHFRNKHKIMLIAALLLAAFVYSCANRGAGPTGGPKDITPPVLLRSNPDNKAVDVKSKYIDLYFDEIVQLDKPNDNIITSPPQKEPVTIKALGKRIAVQINDTLKKNTTYTIDFGDAIQDNNEKNVLKHFMYTFSTGTTLDTMEIAGSLLDARTLDPVSGVLVGVYTNLADSVFTSVPMERIGKSNQQGRFIVRGVKEGAYRLYALDDKDNNYFFSQPSEGIAVCDSLIHPSWVASTYKDSIKSVHEGDSVKVDTVKDVPYTRYLPDSTVLRFFHEEFYRQRYIKGERPEADKLILYFNAPNDTLPVLKPLDFAWNNPPLLQRSLKNDTLTYWLHDTIAAKTDTLNFVLFHQTSDSLGKLVAAIDTVHLKFRHPNQSSPKTSASKKKTKTKPVAVVRTFKIVSNIDQSMDVDKEIQLKFDVPVTQFDSSGVHLEQKVDTVWKTLPVRIIRQDDIGLSYQIPYRLEPEKEYRLKVDSAAAFNLRYKCNDNYSQNFKVRSLDEYASIIVTLNPFIEHAVFELLDNNDKVIRTLKAQPGENHFNYVPPATYYLRLFVDSNDNGKWDTGNYKEQRPPEQVYYYNQKLTERPAWDDEVDWNPTAISLDHQKPRELIKKQKQ